MRCEQCGFDFDASLERCPQCGASVEFSGNTMFFQKAVTSRVKFRDIFSGTFKKHPTGTAAKMFAAGTPETTPAPDKMLTAWQKPWLYSRFLLAGILFSVIFYFISPVVAGSFGSIVFPFAVLMFIWEMNIPRDISFVKVIAFFAAGGLLSILAATLMNNMLSDYEAPFAAFVEEPAKLLITLLFIHMTKPKYGFGGMLIGASVGAGFAVFETVMYVFGTNSISTLVTRSLLAIGGHVTWAAITGAGAALGRKGKSTGFSYLTYPLFWACFIACILMHFTWNGGLLYVFDIETYDPIQILLCVAAIALLFLLINKCLQQVILAYDTACSAMMNKSPAYAAVPAAQPAAAAIPPVQPAMGYAQNSPQPQPVPAAAVNVYYAPPAVPNQPAKPIVRTLRCASLNIARPIDKIINIGRDPTFCDIVFPAGTPGVSRKHCAVMTSPEGFVYVMDLGSSMGTFLPDGRRLAPKQWTFIDGTFYVASDQYAFTVQ